MPVVVSRMEKHFTGGVTGRSATLFTAAFDQTTGIGTYVAMESFEGSLGRRSGTFNFTHAATTSGRDRRDEYFTIVPTSGTGELTGTKGPAAWLWTPTVRTGSGSTTTSPSREPESSHP